MLTISLDDAIEQELNQLAKRTGKPVSQFVIDLIIDYLEDIHDAGLVDIVMDDILSGREPVYTSEQAKAMIYDLAN